MGSAEHNRIVPDLLRQIVSQSSCESEAMVMLESLTLGLMLYYRPNLLEAIEFLDSMTARVIERMQDNG